jgi:hypothetical protein
LTDLDKKTVHPVFNQIGIWQKCFRDPADDGLVDLAAEPVVRVGLSQVLQMRHFFILYFLAHERFLTFFIFLADEIFILFYAALASLN